MLTTWGSKKPFPLCRRLVDCMLNSGGTPMTPRSLPGSFVIELDFFRIPFEGFEDAIVGARKFKPLASLEES